MTIEEKFEELKIIIEGIGKHAYDYFNSDNREHEQKRDKSVVTEVDKKIERLIREYIKTNFPDDTIVGEEEEREEGSSGFVWHIDPIDGTDNFLRKIPFFAISVARLGDDEAESFAIIHNPATKQTFSTFKESPGGVYENERLCNLTAETLGGRFVISISRGRENWMKTASQNLQVALSNKYGKSTAYGCCALEIAYVAANRIDALLTFGLHTYDYAAGLLLIKASEGAISIFENGKWSRWEKGIKELCQEHEKMIFISHPDVHDDILATIGDPESWADR